MGVDVNKTRSNNFTFGRENFFSLITRQFTYENDSIFFDSNITLSPGAVGSIYY
jgi:hypothetical protein